MVDVGLCDNRGRDTVAKEEKRQMLVQEKVGNCGLEMSKQKVVKCVPGFVEKLRVSSRCSMCFQLDLLGRSVPAKDCYEA